MSQRHIRQGLTLAVALAVAPAVRAGQVLLDAGRGPVAVNVPSNAVPGRPLPLVLMLHGFTGTGDQEEAYLRLLPLSEEYGFLYAHPDGTVNVNGDHFWNATDACCDFYGSGVDDAGYLRALVRLIRRNFDVDPWRVYVFGHSNGGFMAHRMGCEHSSMVAAIGSLAGATWLDPADCVPGSPVHALEIHGTADSIVLWGGGSVGMAPYPGVEATVEQWADHGLCLPQFEVGAPLDLDLTLPGKETTVRRYRQACNPAASAELWTIVGGEHVPVIPADFSRHVVDYFFAHPKAGVAFTDETTLTWPPLVWAAHYTVYRGPLSALSDGDGDSLPDGGYGDCVSDTDTVTTDTTLVDPTTPAPGEGFFYLVAFVDTDGEEVPAGSNSAGLPRAVDIPCGAFVSR